MKIDYSEKVRAKHFVAYYNDFDKEKDWKEAYFELLSWKNTWGIPYKMDINWNRKQGTYVIIIIPDNNPDTPQMLKEMMESYGYRNIKISDIKVELVLPEYEDDDIFDYFIK